MKPVAHPDWRPFSTDAVSVPVTAPPPNAQASLWLPSPVPVWRITVRFEGRKPDGQRHYAFAKSLDIDSLTGLPALVAGYDPVDICYLMAVPHGGLVDRFRKRGR